MNTSPFLYLGGQHTGTLEMRYSTHHNSGDNAKPYIIPLGGLPMLTMNAESANALLLSITRCLFDQDTLTMETADRIAYLCHCLLADRDMPMPKHIDPSHISDGWAAAEEPSDDDN